ncbi:MAG: hypothetical protein E7033_05930 [Akkermansiaceae bacterium]|nr:hypothetical protein [Akkermansiaceae bacterium]
MKKFFSILLTAALVLVSVPSCGGGGGSNPTRVTAPEFARGAKYIMLGNGLAGTLFIVPEKNYTGYKPETISYHPNGEPQQEKTGAVQGSIGVGVKGGTDCTFGYVCNYNEEGVPTDAELTISTIQSAQDKQTLVEFFNEATPDDGEQAVDLRGVVTINIDYEAGAFTMKVRAGVDDDDAEGDADPDPDNVAEREDTITVDGQVVVQFR